MFKRLDDLRCCHCQNTKIEQQAPTCSSCSYFVALARLMVSSSSSFSYQTNNRHPVTMLCVDVHYPRGGGSTDFQQISDSCMYQCTTRTNRFSPSFREPRFGVQNKLCEICDGDAEVRERVALLPAETSTARLNETHSKKTTAVMQMNTMIVFVMDIGCMCSTFGIFFFFCLVR